MDARNQINVTQWEETKREIYVKPTVRENVESMKCFVLVNTTNLVARKQTFVFPGEPSLMDLMREVNAMLTVLANVLRMKLSVQAKLILAMVV